jgi:hypothetical protein
MSSLEAPFAPGSSATAVSRAGEGIESPPVAVGPMGCLRHILTPRRDRVQESDHRTMRMQDHGPSPLCPRT